MRKSPLRAVFCREGGGKKSRLPPHLRSPLATTGGSLCGLGFLKPLFVLQKETRRSPEAGALPGPLPSPQPSSAFSTVLLVLFPIAF